MPPRAAVLKVQHLTGGHVWEAVVLGEVFEPSGSFQGL